jgi:hypothetical protein
MLCIFTLPVDASANSSKKHNSMSSIANKKYSIFQAFIDSSFHGIGLKRFKKVSKSIENNITWKGKRGKNRYLSAFKRSYPFLKNYDFGEFPEIIFLIPYLESQWRSHTGNPQEDYGYWQLVRTVIEEIQTLPQAPDDLRLSDPDTIRTNAWLSTEAALIHLRRYYFYFAKVAGFSESDAWFFAMTSYNWGAGNVKRMIAEMKSQNIAVDFSSFYAYLYNAHRASPENKSMKAAVEYLPNLWNIAKVIRAVNP